MSEQTRIGRQSLGQLRGNDAWACVSGLSRLKQEERDDYAIEAKKLPIRIKASGLGQAMAFIAAKAKKGKPGAETLQADLSTWVLKTRNVPWSPGNPEDQEKKKPQDLLRAVIEGDAGFLRWATDETMSYLEWLKPISRSPGSEKQRRRITPEFAKGKRTTRGTHHVSPVRTITTICS